MRKTTRSWNIEAWMRGGIWSGCWPGVEDSFTSPETFSIESVVEGVE